MSEQKDKQLGLLSVRGLDKGRLEALTDGILAVAMTLLVLELKLDGSENIFLLALSLILNINYLARHPALADANLTPDAVEFIHRRLVLFSPIPIAATLVAFVHTRLGLAVYFLMLVAHFFPHQVDGTLNRLKRRKPR